MWAGSTWLVAPNTMHGRPATTARLSVAGRHRRRSAGAASNCRSGRLARSAARAAKRGPLHRSGREADLGPLQRPRQVPGDLFAALCRRSHPRSERARQPRRPAPAPRPAGRTAPMPARSPAARSSRMPVTTNSRWISGSSSSSITERPRGTSRPTCVARTPRRVRAAGAAWRGRSTRARARRPSRSTPCVRPPLLWWGEPRRAAAFKSPGGVGARRGGTSAPA